MAKSHELLVFHGSNVQYVHFAKEHSRASDLYMRCAARANIQRPGYQSFVARRDDYE